MSYIISNNMENEKELSVAVEKRPCLYDKYNKEFLRRDSRLNAWQEIAVELNLKDAEEAEKAFLKLRDRYARARKLATLDEDSPHATKHALRAEGRLANLKHLDWLGKHIKSRTRRSKNGVLYKNEDNNDDGDEKNADATNDEFWQEPKFSVDQQQQVCTVEPTFTVRPTMSADPKLFSSSSLEPMMNGNSSSAIESNLSGKRKAPSDDDDYDSRDSMNSNSPVVVLKKCPSATMATAPALAHAHKMKKVEIVNRNSTPFKDNQRKTEIAPPVFAIATPSRHAQKTDEYDLFGQYVANKMRKLKQVLSDDAMESVEYELTTVLMKARMNKD